jgi:hypothetical protein
MSRTITIDIFNPASIDAAVKEIRDYADWVKRKTNELRERVAYFIAKDASAVFNTAVADDLIGEGAVIGSVDVVVEDNGNMTLVIANGEDAVFMEFGAGVYYNGPVGSSPNPLGTELGFTIGSYSTHKPDKEIWGYKGEDGEIHLTHGTPASMPLYRAVQRVWKDIDRIAQEVFST